MALRRMPDNHQHGGLINPEVDNGVQTGKKEDDFAIPNETRFPLPPLRTLLEFLQEDAKAEAKGKHKHHVCSSVCEEHGTPWNKALANLSQTCHYFHDECSLVRFAKVVVKRDDTLEELERFIKPEYRSAIKMLCISATGATAPHSIFTRLSLPRRFCLDLNQFMVTCPDISVLSDLASCGQTSFKDIAVHGGDVKDLSISLPFPASSKGKPIVEAFPSVRHLRIDEYTTVLVNPTLGGLGPLAEVFETIPGLGDFTSGIAGGMTVTIATLKQKLGTSLPSVTELTLSLVAPIQSSMGTWKNAGKGILLGQLCSLLPNLKTLNIGLAPTHTRDSKDAALLKLIMDSLLKHNIRIKHLTIATLPFRKGALQSSGRPSGQGIPLCHYLLSRSSVVSALSPYCKRYLDLESFRYLHFEADFSEAVCVRQLEVDMRDYGKQSARGKLVKDTWDTQVLNDLYDRTRPGVEHHTVEVDDIDNNPTGESKASAAQPARHGLQSEDFKFGTLTGNQAVADLFAPQMIMQEYDPGAHEAKIDTPKATKTPRTGENGHPLPVLRLVAKYMEAVVMETAHGRDRLRNAQQCGLGCSLHDVPWDSRLSNLSATCHPLRSLLWPKRLTRLLIQPGENFSALETAIPPHQRGIIREICLASAGISEKSAGPRHLGAKFARKLSAFMTTCSNLQQYVDLNVSPAPTVLGPSVSHPTVGEVHLGFPSLSLQDTPLYKAFPRVERLSFHERSVNLFTEKDDVEHWSESDAISYMCSMLGDEVYPVRGLRLHIVIPHERESGEWKTLVGKLALECFLSRFVNLAHLEINIVPPYTRDPDNACMVPEVLRCIARSSPTLRELTITTVGFGWKSLQMVLAEMKESPKQLFVENLLPLKAVTAKTVREVLPNLPQLHKVTISHNQDIANVRICIRQHDLTDNGFGFVLGRQLTESYHTGTEVFVLLNEHMAVIERVVEKCRTQNLPPDSDFPLLYSFPIPVQYRKT